ncbi:MAG: exodeoxyribonuclease VII small subunit, partial [Candidatus Dormibacteria bacterium]
ISCYERGTRLAQHCERLLDRTEQKVTQVVVGGGGEREQPFEPLTGPAGISSPPDPDAPPPGQRAPLPGPARARSVGGPLPFAPGGGRPQQPVVDPDEIPF